MDSMPSVVGAHCSGEPTRSASSSFTGRTLTQPCTATPCSLPPSLVSGLTTASVASVDTTSTAASNTSYVVKVQPCSWTASYATPDTHAKVDDAPGVTATPSTIEIPAAASTENVAADLPPVATTHLFQLPVPFAEHDVTLPLFPLANGTSQMCCGPPPLVPSEEAHRATSAAKFLEDNLSAAVESSVAVTPKRTPKEAELPGWCANRVRVPSTLAYLPPLSVMDATAATETLTSPAATVSVSPTTCSTATTTGASQHRSRSFDTPLPNCSHYPTFEDLLSCRPDESRDGHASPLTIDSAPYRDGGLAPLSQLQHLGAPPPCQQQTLRHSRQHVLSHADPLDSHVTLSALTTPVTPTPVTAAVATTSGAWAATPAVAAVVQCSDDADSGITTVRRQTSPRTLSEVGTALPRVISLDAEATLSSTLSRPALTPAAIGLIPGTGTSTAGSTAASTTVTSITYTRKNVSLGALDFYGNPVTSLSTLLAQMSVRSGDKDELEQLDLRHNTQHQQQQQQRNTLSMQNLKAHTQQVGVMCPEDKIKRLRGRLDTAATPTASALRRRRASYPTSGTVTGCTSPTASSPYSGKQQVGCLKDVLQECKFLCINDVISAVVETQVQELQEAQQLLEGGSGYVSRANTTSTTIGEAAAATAAAGADGKGSTSEGAETSAGETNGAVMISAPGFPPPPLPPQQRAASPSTSVWSEDIHSPLTRGGTGNTSFIAAAAAGLPTSTDMIDPQHALSLAAAITEVSLNLERASEVSSSASHLATVTTSSTHRSQLLRAASGRTATCSMGDAASPSVTSGSLPNLASEMPVDVSHTSTVITPVQLNPPTSCSSCAPSSPTDLTSTPHAHVVSMFPADPLERKVLRSSSSAAAIEANRSSVSARSGGSPTTLSQTTQSTEMAALESASAVAAVEVKTFHSACVVGADVFPSPAAGETTIRERCSGVRGSGGTRSSGSTRCILTGRYVPNWHGLSANGEGNAWGDDVTCNSPTRLLPPRPQNKDDGDCLARSIIGDAEEFGKDGTATVTGGWSQEPTGPSNSASQRRVMVDSMVCASFDDELTTVRELRKWARCVVQQEMLQPSTETEVTT
jgi:hypothetical protein